LAKGHDHFVRRTLADLKLAASFLRFVLSEQIADALELEAIDLEPESYIDESLAEVITDMVYRVPYRHYPSCITVLVEHKSEGAGRKGGANLPFQLRRQEMEIMEHNRRNHPKGKMPIVILVGLYHGQKRYRGPLTVAESIEGPRELIPGRWKERDMVLVDLGRYSDDQLEQGGKLGLFLQLLKHIYDRNLLDLLVRLVPSIKEVDRTEGGREFLLSMFVYLYEASRIETKREIEEKVVKSLPIELGGHVMTIAEQLRQEGRQEGRVEGRQEAREELAHKMLNQGFDLSLIAQLTGISLQKVTSMKGVKDT